MSSLRAKRVAMVMFSYYPMDPRPRRAAEALANEGMHVDVICLKETGADPKREIFNGVDILRIPLQRRRTGPVGYVFQYVAFILISTVVVGLRSLTRRYDLVYVHNMPDVLVLSALIPKVLGAKVILDLHDPMPELMMTIFDLDQESWWVRILKRLEKWSLRLADLVLTVNLACEKLFVSRGCRREKIRVIMNSPDDEIFGFQPPRGVTAGRYGAAKPFVIMYHGSLVERNGLDLAVEAVGRLRESIRDAELRIYGSRTGFLERVMEKVRTKGLTEVVRYLGPRRIEDIVKAIDECDVGPDSGIVACDRMNHRHQSDMLALGAQLLRRFIRQVAAETPTSNEVRSSRLDRADFTDVPGNQLFKSRRRCSPVPVQHVRL